MQHFLPCCLLYGKFLLSSTDFDDANNVPSANITKKKKKKKKIEEKDNFTLAFFLLGNLDTDE